MIKFQVEEGAELPKYGSELASGMDVTAFKILKVFRGDREIEPEKLIQVQEGFEERGYIKLRSLERILFGTGLKASIPEDSEIQVRSRSGVALKRGLSVLNSPGTVDADYTGEIGIILYNSTPFLNQVDRGERIAQLVVSKVERPQVEQVYEDLESVHSRGEDGFGSTGSK